MRDVVSDANNFSKPVYDSMFRPGKVSEFFKVIRFGLFGKVRFLNLD